MNPPLRTVLIGEIAWAIVAAYRVTRRAAAWAWTVVLLADRGRREWL